MGHTGVYDAAVKAISATDAAVGTIAQAASAAGYVLLITADHGNAEQMINPDTGAPHTAHTTNPVPFIVKAPATGGSGEVYKFLSDEEAGKGEKKGETDEGALCDVAPTILDVMVRRGVSSLVFCVKFLIARTTGSPRARGDDWPIPAQARLGFHWYYSTGIASTQFSRPARDTNQEPNVY